tara:strand:- start:31 stop:165 length:135 start_codon:yes stop_codon:yes gene_type:complete
METVLKFKMPVVILKVVAIETKTSELSKAKVFDLVELIIFCIIL